MEGEHEGRVYAVPGFLLVAANGSAARFVGYRPGIERDGRWIDMPIFRQTTEFFTPGSFLQFLLPRKKLLQGSSGI